MLTACGGALVAAQASSEGSGEGSTSTDEPTTEEPSVPLPTPPPTVFTFQATAAVPFREEFNNPSSPEYRNLERRVVRECRNAYRDSFAAFLDCLVREFRPARTLPRMPDTEVEMDVLFNSSASSEDIPTIDNVTQTLVDSLNMSSVFLADTIRPVVTNTTATPTPTSFTTPIVITDTTAVTIETLSTTLMTFRSTGVPFSSALLNRTSPEYQARASLVITELTPFFTDTFDEFRGLAVISFSQGSILNQLAGIFASNGVPNATELLNFFLGLSSNNTSLNIDPNFLLVNGTQVSSGVSYKISLITISFPVLLSWLLSRH